MSKLDVTEARHTDVYEQVPRCTVAHIEKKAAGLKQSLVEHQPPLFYVFDVIFNLIIIKSAELEDC